MFISQGSERKERVPALLRFRNPLRNAIARCCLCLLPTQLLRGRRMKKRRLREFLSKTPLPFMFLDYTPEILICQSPFSKKFCSVITESDSLYTISRFNSTFRMKTHTQKGHSYFSMISSATPILWAVMPMCFITPCSFRLRTVSYIPVPSSGL